MHRPPRDYAGVIAAAHGLRGVSPDVAMQRVVRILWDAFGLDARTSAGALSWVGFYRKEPGEEMTLVCREPKPACSPIGLHGMCGRSWLERRPIVIPDVRTLSGNYIACDPKDQSELVIPVIQADGTCWGVLDLDSYDTHAFTTHDARGMTAVLEAAALSAPREEHLRPLLF
jgi:putative methionine-R-sulfoxide reductase with GAF domain